MAFAKTDENNNRYNGWGKTVTTTLDAAAGDCIVVFAFTDQPGSISASDTTNGAYSSGTQVNAQGLRITPLYFLNSAALSGVTVTVTSSVDQDYVGVYAASWSGILSADAFDQETSFGEWNDGTPGTVSSGAVTTTAADIVFGCISSATANPTVTAGGTETLDLSNYAVYTTTVHASVEHFAQSASGSIAMTFAMEHRYPYITKLISFKPAASQSVIPSVMHHYKLMET